MPMEVVDRLMETVDMLMEAVDRLIGVDMPCIVKTEASLIHCCSES
jgi:hypothetical protein